MMRMYRQSESHMMTLLLFLLTVAALTMADSGATFKEKAAENVKVEYSQGRSYSEMTVSYNPHDLLEDEEAGEVSLTLETKTGDGCWRRAGSRTRLRKVDVWRVEVFPCQEVTTRLVLQKEQCVLHLPTASLGPASKEEYSQAGYRPPDPSSPLLTASEAGAVFLSFTGSPCVEEYQVYYESEDGDDVGSLTVSKHNTKDVNITSMDQDSTYSISIVAMVGSQFGSASLQENPRRLEVKDGSTPSSGETECSPQQVVCTTPDPPPHPEPEPEISVAGFGRGVRQETGLALLLLTLWLSLQ